MDETPLSFDAIIGHARPKAILKAVLASGRAAHAYLFHGEAQIGKRMTAMAFVGTALCGERETAPSASGGSGRPTLTACGRCVSCRAVRSGSHPDILRLEPDGAQIKIGQIRDLQNAIAYKPLLGSRKWFIVDDAEALNLEAANCFLKTLEEPPDHSTLILITARPHLLLSTIRSRCQAVRFIPPPEGETSAWLARRRGLSLEEARILTTLSMGRIGIAAEADPAALKAERDRVLDALSEEHLSDPASLFQAPEELAATQEQLYKTLDAVEIWLRDVLIVRHGAETAQLINQDVRELIRTWGRGISTDRILETVSLIHRFRRAAPRNLNPALVLETVLLNLRNAEVGRVGSENRRSLTRDGAS